MRSSSAKIAVRVDYTDAMSGGNVLDDEISEKGGLAHASFADEVEVMAAVVGVHAEKGGFAAP